MGKVKYEFRLESRTICATGKFPKKSVKKAIKESIRKWKFIAGLDDLTNVCCGHCGSCALCKLFLTPHMSCDGCPIPERVGNTGCRGTPYSDFYSVSSHEDKLAVAQAEITFLQSLYTIYTSKTYKVEYKDGNATIGLKGEFPEMTDLEAIKESAKKWKFILAVASDPTFKGIVCDGCTTTCALCATHSENCSSCPASVDTGCCGNAYQEWCSAFSKQEHIDAAEAMIEFLRDAEKKEILAEFSSRLSCEPVQFEWLTPCEPSFRSHEVIKSPSDIPVKHAPLPEPDVKIEACGHVVKFHFVDRVVGDLIECYVGIHGKLDRGIGIWLWVNQFTDMEALVEWIECRLKRGGLTTEML